MQTLYVYNNKNDKEVAKNMSVISYCLGHGNIIGEKVNNINSADKLNAIASENAQLYSNFIFSQNKKFVKNKLLFQNNLSLYFLTDFSCKRTEIFGTYSNYCNSLLIAESLKEHEISKVVFDGCSHAFVESCSSIIGKNSYEVKHTSKSKINTKFIFLKNIYFFLSVFLSVILEKLLFLEKKDANSKGLKRFFLTRYPLHLNCNLEESKYGKLVSKNDTFLVNILTDGIHQNIGLMSYIRHLRYLSKLSNICILDRYLSLSDVLKGAYYSFKIRHYFKPLYNDSYICNGINISLGVCEELKSSTSRLPRLIMLGSAIKRFTLLNQVNEFYYYLHEYSYGRIFTYVFHNHSPNTKLIGFQHGPSSRRKMVYLNGKDELRVDSNGIDSFYLPKMVLAEDSYSVDLYKASGYSNVKLMDRVYRLSYLKNIQRKKSDKNYILIVPGLHDGRHLLETMKHDILINTKDTYILKPHPRASNNYIGDYSYIENLTISNSHISKLLGMVQKAFVTYSSVAIEAKILGIDVELIEIPGRVNESPLIDSDFISCIKNIRY